MNARTPWGRGPTPAALAAILFLSPLPAQAIPAGFSADVAYHGVFQNANVLGIAASADGSRFFFARGFEIWEQLEGGGIVPLHSFPIGDPPGLLTRPDGADELWFTGFTSREVWRLDLGTGDERMMGRALANTFDLVRAPGGEWLATANPLWPRQGARAGVFLLDLAQEQHREIIVLSGPSGPLAFDAAGNLYYATQSDLFPPPPAATDVVRFPAALVADAIAGRRTLTLADAAVVLRGLASGYDLAFDDRGRLYVSAPFGGVVYRSTPGVTGLEPSPFVDGAGRGATFLAALPAGPGTFDPWQPRGAGALFVTLSDWQASETHVLRIEPARPALASVPASPAPPGRVTITLRGGPASGFALLCVASRQVQEQPVLTLSGVPLWFGLDPLSLWTVPAGLDLAGAADLTFFHAGGLAAEAQLQAVAVSPRLEPASSNPYSLRLLP
jgi:hypothetical protein